MRYFDDILFCGAGESSEIGIEVLKDTLDSAIDLLAGLQQPDHSSSEEAALIAIEARERDEKVLQECVRDICMALTGKEWEPK